MSSLKNKVQLIGNLGQDVEIVNLESGKKLAKFSFATNEVYKNPKGEKVTNTDWHNLIAWGKTAELVEKLLVKGSEVAIEGKLTSRSYEDKDGVKKYITEVVVNEFLLMSGGNPKNIEVKNKEEVK
jgi:single-strand DNA-binding protein